MTVKYVYPANVQVMLDEIEKGFNHENEWLAKQLDGAKYDTACVASVNMQFIMDKYDARINPLIEAKSRIVNNVLPIEIIITK